jgi:hypothetical protein
LPRLVYFSLKHVEVPPVSSLVISFENDLVHLVWQDEAHRLKDKLGKTRGCIADLDKDFLLLLTGIR